MFWIAKFIKAWFLPPGLFITCLILITFRARRMIKMFCLFLASLIYLLSIEPIGDLLIKPLEDAYPPLRISSNLNAQYIVILGGGIVPNSPEFKTDSPKGLERIYFGYYLWKSLNIPIIASGGTLKGRISEGRAIAALLETLGVPGQQIIIEEKGRNTWEEAVEVNKLLGRKGQKLLLVTSAHHMPRSVLLFKNLHLNVIPAPTDYKANRNSYDLLSFLPSEEYLRKSAEALHEYLGIFYCKLRGIKILEPE